MLRVRGRNHPKAASTATTEGIHMPMINPSSLLSTLWFHLSRLMNFCISPETTHSSASHALSDTELVAAVDEAYSAKAKAGTSPAYAKNVATAFGYTEEQLRCVPIDSHMGLSCGNPVATATLKLGETVLDLGSGGGIDVFLAASKVGPTGQVVGLDMSPDMIALARKNAKKQNLHPPNVSFVQALLTENLPIISDSVDVILSNCVINLIPSSGKAKVLKEAYRVLKPGGRIVLDDIIAKAPLPEDIKNDLWAHVGCISGAIEGAQYKELLLDAGFKDAIFVDTKCDLNVCYQDGTESKNTKSGCCSPAPLSVSAPPHFDANTWVASYQIYAIKEKTDLTPPSNLGTILTSLWDAYPKPQSSPEVITVNDVAALVRDGSLKEEDFAIIDVRRNDHGGGHVRGSQQFPAQTFYDVLPSFFEKFGNTRKVIFYCNSSAGRGPRCAGWYRDFLNEMGNTSSKAYVMKGGIKSWLAEFEGQADLTDQD